MGRIRIQGLKSTRRLLKALPETMRAEIAHVLQDAGPKIAQQMVARTPHRTGALQAGIKWKILPRTLKLQIGLLGTKRGRSKLFYGYILNFGRKAQTVHAMRKGQRASWNAWIASGKAKSTRIPYGLTYPLRVKAIAPKHFVTGAMPDLRRELRAQLKDVWSKVLGKATAGAGNE
jgi:hypothetical protein